MSEESTIDNGDTDEAVTVRRPVFAGGSSIGTI